MKQVTIYISDELHALAAANAEEKFGLTTKEYLSDLVSDVLIEMKELFESPPIFPFEIWFPTEDQEPATDERQKKFDWLGELEEDAGGGMGPKRDEEDDGESNPSRKPDMDDGIPF